MNKNLGGVQESYEKRLYYLVISWIKCRAAIRKDIKEVSEYDYRGKRIVIENKKYGKNIWVVCDDIRKLDIKNFVKDIKKHFKDKVSKEVINVFIASNYFPNIEKYIMEIDEELYIAIFKNSKPIIIHSTINKHPDKKKIIENMIKGDYEK